MEPFKPQHGLPLKPLKRLNPLALEKSAGLLIPEIYSPSFQWPIVFGKIIIKNGFVKTRLSRAEPVLDLIGDGNPG
jgi:hypothetical protein